MDNYTSLLIERLNLLIQLNFGSKRRQLLRLKAKNQLEIDSHLWTVDDKEDDLTLHLLETCVQLPSTKLTDALRREGPNIFSHISDWTVFNTTVAEIDDVVSFRRCIEKWIRHAILISRYQDKTCPTLLYSFPPDCRQVQKLIEWLDDHGVAKRS